MTPNNYFLVPGKWLFPGNSYKYHIRLKKMTYYESENYCQTLGGHPAGKRLINTDLLRWMLILKNYYGKTAQTAKDF